MERRRGEESKVSFWTLWKSSWIHLKQPGRGPELSGSEVLLHHGARLQQLWSQVSRGGFPADELLSDCDTESRGADHSWPLPRHPARTKPAFCSALRPAAFSSISGRQDYFISSVTGSEVREAGRFPLNVLSPFSYWNSDKQKINVILVQSWMFVWPNKGSFGGSDAAKNPSRTDRSGPSDGLPPNFCCDQFKVTHWGRVGSGLGLD